MFADRWQTIVDAIGYLTWEHPRPARRRRQRGAAAGRVASRTPLLRHRSEASRWAWRSIRRRPASLGRYLALAVASGVSAHRRSSGGRTGRGAVSRTSTDAVVAPRPEPRSRSSGVLPAAARPTRGLHRLRRADVRARGHRHAADGRPGARSSSRPSPCSRSCPTSPSSVPTPGIVRFVARSTRAGAAPGCSDRSCWVAFVPAIAVSTIAGIATVVWAVPLAEVLSRSDPQEVAAYLRIFGPFIPVGDDGDHRARGDARVRDDAAVGRDPVVATPAMKPVVILLAAIGGSTVTGLAWAGRSRRRSPASRRVVLPRSPRGPCGAMRPRARR